jgi:hypothetical protein
MAQLTFEVNREAALGFMPCDVSRPVPCYARLIVVDAQASPAGPVRIAALFVGGRYRMMPRNMLVEAIVDGDVDVVAAALGSPYRAGTVTLERTDSQLAAGVASSEGQLARLALPALSAGSRMLRWDPGSGSLTQTEHCSWWVQPAAAATRHS